LRFCLDLKHQCTVGGEQYDLVIVDNAGSDQYTINHSDFDNSDAYILIYAIDDRQRYLFCFLSKFSFGVLFYMFSFEMVSKIRDKIISTSASVR